MGGDSTASGAGGDTITPRAGMPVDTSGGQTMIQGGAGPQPPRAGLPQPAGRAVGGMQSPMGAVRAEQRSLLDSLRPVDCHNRAVW